MSVFWISYNRMLENQMRWRQSVRVRGRPKRMVSDKDRISGTVAEYHFRVDLLRMATYVNVESCILVWGAIIVKEQSWRSGMETHYRPRPSYSEIQRWIGSLLTERYAEVSWVSLVTANVHRNYIRQVMDGAWRVILTVFFCCYLAFVSFQVFNLYVKIGSVVVGWTGGRIYVPSFNTMRASENV
jgi:hypothetical protein